MTGKRNQNNGGQNTYGNNTDINLFTNIQYDEMKAFVTESFNCALLDLGCTKSVEKLGITFIKKI